MIRWPLAVVLALVAALAVMSRNPTLAQGPAGSGSGRLNIAARSSAEAAAWEPLLGQMVLARELVSVDVHDDPMIGGRHEEGWRQVYRGIPVDGGSLTRQLAGTTTISAIGTVFTGIALDPVPGLTAGDAERMLERESNSSLLPGTAPVLLVSPTLTGGYLLIYRATMRNAKTYDLDANTGQVVRAINAADSDVGTGTGVLGDTKKLSTSKVGSTYRTQDVLRPFGVNTLDTRNNVSNFTRIVNNASWSDSDFSTDDDNVWTDGRVVDTHVHAGWSADYFFKRFQWSGFDGTGRLISAVVDRTTKDNAFSYPAPFGPNGGGAIVFGDTSGGVPVNTLDVVGHELMHSVTSNSLIRRTGQGLQSTLVLEGLGTTSFTFNGSVFSCATAFVVDSTGAQFPFWCSGGRFVLAANEGGAINEGFSDMFGTSIEFFYQPRGNGRLMADYLMAEDIPVFGPNRSLNAPASLPISTDTGTIPYPDNRSRMLSYALVIRQGTQANPTIVDISGAAFVNGSPVTFFNRGVDTGGVHYNSTILSHAFYLAIEGGTNATSGRTVPGVGAQNREQIERVFFRAMTQFMPSAATLTSAASAINQAAADLYGANSSVGQAVSQALQAVGL